MRKFVFIISFFFLVLFVITTVVFAFLFFRTQSELNQKTSSLSDSLSEIEALELQISENKESEGTEGVVSRFEDTGADIYIEYPIDWQLTLDTDLSEDFATEPYARVLNGYEINVQKGSAILNFSRILGAVDGFGSGLKASEYDILEITDTITRFALKGTNEWTYAESIDCADLELFLEESPENYDVCVGSFFPNFANIGAAQVSITNANNSILAEADYIVLSTQ